MNKKILGAPYYIWAGMFIVVPLLLVFFYSCIDFSGGQLRFTGEHFEKFFEPVYLKVLWRSLVLAFWCTVICLLVGYPMAYILASKEFIRKRYLLFLCILPMWMNMLLRTYAWMTILEKNGVLNSFLGIFGVEPIQFLYNGGAVLLGMVYNFLPFMILPIYSVLTKMDKNLIEAAQDLGADSKTVFRKVVFPLSLPGVMSGIIMVFMPAVTTFVISRLLGGGKFQMVGNLIEQQFVTVHNWGFGSAVSIVMMILILISMAIINRSDDAKNSIGGGFF